MTIHKAAPVVVSQMMRGVSVQMLRFTMQSIDAVTFDGFAGSAIRGALYESLSAHFCSMRFGARSSAHKSSCPVCWLLDAEDPNSARGENVPRALTVQPPAARVYKSGQTWSFGVGLVGNAQNIMPTLLRAVHKMGERGIGRGGGRFALVSVDEVHPIFDASRVILREGRLVAPTLQVTPEQVRDAARGMSQTHFLFDIVTPARIVKDGKPLQRIEPVAFVQRLVERCEAMATYYAEFAPGEAKPTRDAWRDAYHAASDAAQYLRVGYDETRWQGAWSHSNRTGENTSLSGLVGRVRFDGETLPQVLEWLLWGSVLHVGKGAIKGAGWYQVIAG